MLYTEDPIVSSDIVKNPASSIVDSPADRGDGRHDGQGRRLVRQRVGLLQPRRRLVQQLAVRTLADLGELERQAGPRPGRLQRSARRTARSPTTRGSGRRCRRSRSCANAARALVLVSHLGRPKDREPGALAARRWPTGCPSCSGAEVTLAPGRWSATTSRRWPTALGAGRGAAAGEHPLRAGRDQERPRARRGAGRAGRRLRQRRLRRRAPRPRLDRGRRAADARARRRAAARARGDDAHRAAARTRRGRWWRCSAAPRCSDKIARDRALPARSPTRS